MKRELPSRAMSFEVAKALGLRVKAVDGETATLSITTELTTQIKQGLDGRHFVTIRFGGKYRDIYIQMPRKKRS